MNKLNRAMICLPLLFFSMLPIATTPSLSQYNLLQEKDVDFAYRVDANDDRETQLKKEKIRSAMAELESQRRRVMEGRDPIFAQVECQNRLVTALLDFHKDPEKIISLLEDNVEVTKQTEADRKQRLDNGVGRPDDSAQATYFRADAELKLLRAKQKFNVERNELPLPLPFPQLENAPEMSDQLRDGIPRELDLSGGRALPELGDGNERHATQDDLFDEWKNGKYSPAIYQINPGDDLETRLKKQRINMALMEKNHLTKLLEAGVQSLDVTFESQKRLLEAQLDFHTEPKEIVFALQQAFESSTQVEAIVRNMYQEKADVNIQQVGQAMYNRLGCELKLLRTKKKYGLLEHSAEEEKK